MPVRTCDYFIGATWAGPNVTSPQLATAVWFGNRNSNIGGAGFGGVSSAPIFKAFMDPALAAVPDVGLPDPPAPPFPFAPSPERPQATVTVQPNSNTKVG